MQSALALARDQVKTGFTQQFLVAQSADLKKQFGKDHLLGSLAEFNKIEPAIASLEARCKKVQDAHLWKSIIIF